MSVLIKGMEMPESCNACRLLEGDRDDGLCHAANRWLDDDEYWLWPQYPEGDVDTSKPSNCPLIEVVRCKDCRFYQQSEVDPGRKMCQRKDVDGWSVCYDFCPTDFCSYGEGRTYDANVH